MRKRTLESYIKQSYNTYLSKLADLQYQGKGLSKKEITYNQYKEYYLYSSNEERSRLSSKVAKQSLTFSREEARVIAEIIKDYPEFVNSWFIDVKMTKKGTYNINDLINKVQSLSGEMAHDFISELVDKGIIESGQQLEEAIY